MKPADVNEADREAAKPFMGDAVHHGALDDHRMIQSFARHRIAAYEAGRVAGLEEKYKTFTDGMEAAAEICGSLAETTYDDADGFEAATGCEASIMRVVRQQRKEQSAVRALKEKSDG